MHKAVPFLPMQSTPRHKASFLIKITIRLGSLWLLVRCDSILRGTIETSPKQLVRACVGGRFRGVGGGLTRAGKWERKKVNKG